MRKRDRNVAFGTLIAAGIGYAAGVLTAPKSGRETRKGIQKAAIKAKKDAEANLKDLHVELNELISQGKRKGTNLKSAAKTEYENALKKAQQAKTKAGEILSAIHEGDADDRDLDKAVRDIKKSIEHLRKYVEKEKKTK